MIKSISYRFTLCLCLLFSVANLSADTLTVTWTGAIGELETTIMADTLADGSQAHAVYKLESNKVYLQRSTIVLETSCDIVGAAYGDGETPATIQPIPGDDGASQFAGWPAGNIKTYGEDQSYAFKNLLFNGVFADGSTTLFGVLATYGKRNTITVDHVTSVHNQVITYFCFGQEEHWTLTNNTAVQYSCYPAGMYFGGFWWGGGGGWTGTVESLLIQNNTIEGAHGQAFVIYDNGLVNRTGSEMIYVDHNTFANIIDWPKFYRHGNNTHWTNNLFVNLAANGQTRNAGNTNIALNNDHNGGHGKTATLDQGPCTDSTLTADGNCWDNTNRNIRYTHNVWYDTPELLDMFSMDPWCWDLPADSNGVVVTLCDTMIAGQSKWIGDSTRSNFSNGVSEVNNIHAGSDFGWNLDAAYITAQTTRTRDWLDNGVHDTHTTHFWMHQADSDPISVQWPLPLDFSYSATSAAATHCTHGGPVGSTHHMTHAADLTMGTTPEGEIVPGAFALAQNYPNPFNPSTEISFTLNEAADINLSIFNMLGQKVRTLTTGSKPAGVYSLEWDGRDEMGQSVSTGIYLYTLTNGSTSITKKMALMK
ncbi:uncharacterized protein METZ01_LOCUS7765 [marine metagenome]|uniref:FlgD/Vpr Ig-like domain-containing protein n=1 Tax=marine metagenome TaxID=408172 RepID=A0A381NK47_9ZZZZ|nr:FlgD immunoglobulin-like domain containing protein [Candidatus Neomarinimicrobiota bacterium]